MSFCIVVGYGSIEIKDKLKERFGFKFDWDNKVWFKPVSIDKYTFFEKAIESMNDNIDCFWVSSLSLVSDVKKEIVQKEVEVKPHALDGSVFEVTKWYANTFKDNHGAKFAFRNIKIKKVYIETDRAYQVDAEYFGGVGRCCGICGRGLDNAISKACGIGPICAEKIGMDRPTMETAQETLKKMELISKQQGSFNKVWIPKSQIKEVL